MRFCAVFQTTNFHMEVWARTKMLKGLIDTLVWFACNFSLKYPSTLLQTSNESSQMYRVKVVILIKYLILATNLKGKM